MIRAESVIATTSIDNQGERLTPEALNHLVEWIEAHFVPIGIEHDPRIAPIGRIASAFVRDRGDGEKEVVAVLDVFEDGDDPPDDHRELVIRDGEGGMVITYDWTHRHAVDQEDIKAIAGLLGTPAIYEGKKSAEPISVITLATGFVLSSIAGGFFGEIGSAAFCKVKERLLGIFRRKQDRKGDQLLKLSALIEREGKPVEVVLLVTNPSEQDIDGVLSDGLAALDRILPSCIDSAPDVRRLTFEYKAGEVSMLFGVRKDCRPLAPNDNDQAKPTDEANREKSNMATRKIGRDAGTGLFKPVKDAQKDKQGSVVETIKVPTKKPGKKK